MNRILDKDVPVTINLHVIFAKKKKRVVIAAITEIAKTNHP